jgi:hypothetical protein
MTVSRIGTALAVALLAAPGYATTQAELEEALVGNTFQGGMGGAGYSSYFAEDGTYHDPEYSGPYQITEDGVCYPGTDFGCWQATIEGTTLEWIKDGESAGTGEILEGDPLNLMN